MKYTDFLTEEYGKHIEIKGVVATGLENMDHLTALVHCIRSLNFPKQYTCLLNDKTYLRTLHIIDTFKKSFNESVTAELKTGINSMTCEGVDFIIEHNKINDLNIMIPLNLNLVTPENSILIKPLN